jgi:hypothetical protein
MGRGLPKNNNAKKKNANNKTPTKNSKFSECLEML